MKYTPKFLLSLALALATVMQGNAQNSLSARLVDSSNGEPVSFATVSLTAQGAKKPSKYALSTDKGIVLLNGVRPGKYIFKAELLGYKTHSRTVDIEGRVNLGEVKMDPDATQLEGAAVSAVGNPIIIKKDTIEYNASSFKTTDNDVLEDLLKKLPGVEVSEDGSITSNGQTISKITIDGKTFFLDDPQLASKNIPAKIINKLKVVNKKSEQAEFTGIDDGEEETVIDLSIKPGMMKGLFGNLMGGGGTDLPSQKGVDPDFRFQGAGFMGKFTKKTQISVILNANNTNNRGFNDLSANMMGNIRGGGGGMGRGQGGWGRQNGITTSYMAGTNGSFTLLDDKMDLNGNYLYNHTDKDVEESSIKTTYLEDSNIIYNTSGYSNTMSDGHRFGMRLEHKFSPNTSILFEPRVDFGTGKYSETSDYTTLTDYLTGDDPVATNSGHSLNSGNNRNVSTSGFALLRQRLGIPGRTLTVMGRYSFSNNDLDGLNRSTTSFVTDDGENVTEINQSVDQNRRSSSLFARATYTEPLGGGFYVEANYGYTWSQSTSEKNTFDFITGQKDYTYSNEILNESAVQEFGGNVMYQREKSRAQLGFAAIPTKTYNRTTRLDTMTGEFEPMEYDPGVIWRFSPRAMAWLEFSENANARLFYRGSSNQPSTSQLMPVPDNTNPLNVSFGNPELLPYFTHNLRGDVRYNNRRTFSSFNIRFNASYVQSPVVNATWYDGGAQYSMPFNGPSSASAGMNGFLNLPIGKSNFSIANMCRLNWSKSSSYVGKGIDMSLYTEGGDYYAFMEDLLEKTADNFGEYFTTNTIRSVTAVERLRLIYRNDALELTGSGRTRMSRSTYTISTLADNTLTWNNQIRLTANWTWESAGLTFKAEGDYNWYRGYSTKQSDEYVVNAELQKLLFKRKVTLAVKCYDIMGQAKNLTVTDESNFHQETRNNTLGRYIVASLTWRFGTFDRSAMRGHGGPGGRHGGPGGMGGPPRF